MSAPDRSQARIARRALFLAGIGAMTGLILAGASLCTARGTVVRSVPPEMVALVNQRPILRRDFIVQLQSLYGVSPAAATGAQRQRVLKDMIREELLVQRGLELDLPSGDADTRAALVNAVELQAAADVTAGEPADAELESFYTEHRDRYATEGVMEVDDLIVSPAGRSLADIRFAAQSAIAALRSGVPVEVVEQRYGLRSSGATRGEEFYFAARLHLGEPLFAAAASLAGGALSSPVVDGNGTHVLRMTRNTPPVPEPYATVRDRVLGDYRRAATGRVMEATERYLTDRADILVAEDMK